MIKFIPNNYLLPLQCPATFRRIYEKWDAAQGKLNRRHHRRQHHSCQNYQTLGNWNRGVSWRLLVQFFQAEQ